MNIGKILRRLRGASAAEPVVDDRTLVQQSRLFDAHWYASTYPHDAASSDVALDDYLSRGWRAGRWPNPDFDPAAYRKAYPDALTAEDDPLLHYLKVGRTNGLLPGGDTLDVSRTQTFRAFMGEALALREAPRFVEFGTLRSVAERPTALVGLFPNVGADDYVRSDVEGGLDVDVVADLHELPADWSNGFDAAIAIAVFEHLARPWIAAAEVARILKPGGIAMIVTHQTFPLHGYPSDYFRFSLPALRLIFEDAGLQIVASDYNARSRIEPQADFVHPALLDGWNETFPSYTLVSVFVRKPAK